MKILDSTISRKLKDSIERELQKGEFVSFIEQPRPRYFTGASIGAFLFGIPWTIFSLSWMVYIFLLTTGHETPNLIDQLFPLFGIPFVLVGFALLSSPIWTYRNACETAYVITDRRAISFSGGFIATIRSVFADDFDNLYRKERSDCSGDVIFGIAAERDSDGHVNNIPYGFLGVENAKATEERLRELVSTNSKCLRGSSKNGFQKRHERKDSLRELTS